MKISNTNDVNETKIRCLLAGFSGSGKTTAARTLKAYKPLVISAESGLLSLAGSGVDYIDISKDDEGRLIPKERRAQRLAEVYKYVQTPEAKAKYGLLYLDSLTEMSQVLHDALRMQFPERKDNLVMFGELKNKSIDLIKSFRDIPHYHVVMTVLSFADKDETTGKRYVAFDIIGGLKDKLAQYFDLVLFMRVTPEGEREIVTQGTDAITAKDRSARLKATEPADLGKLFNTALGVK